MTLRGRLTTAFLAVVLTPVLLGSIFVGITVTSVHSERAVERLDHATTTVRTAVGALCRQLQAVADAIAVLPEGSRGTAADQIVARGVASAVRIAAPDGTPVFSTPGVPLPAPGGPGPALRDCAAPDAPGAGVVAIAARADTRDPQGRLLGTVWAAQSLDGAFVHRLAASTGTEVTLLGDTGVAFSTEPADAWPAIMNHPAAGPSSATDHGGRHLRRLLPSPGQPLPLVLSVPGGEPTNLYALLVSAVVLVVAATVLVAGWLARSTTRPLDGVARAAGRVAAGELDTRVPVLRQDELGRLAVAFNRMTRELQAHVQALTASRDQLRGHLTVLGDTLSSTHDLHRILQVILRTALGSTGARAGAVLLVDPDGGVLVPHSAEGLHGRWALPDEEITALRLPLGEGILGEVAASGQARRGGPIAAGRPGVPDEPACRAYLAVPICAPPAAEPPHPPADRSAFGAADRSAFGAADGRAADGRAAGGGAAGGATEVLGVLALYDRLGADDFTDADLLTLRRFAGQAGIAVNNVRMHEEAQRLSLTDPLTGLWNYRSLQESLGREVERAHRFGRMLTVLVLDLDHFKQVNDTYGHAAGDAVLGEFARRIRIGLREVDQAFRQGGEEFAVLLPETDAYGGVVVAERLGAAVRDIAVSIDSRRPDAVGAPTVERIGVSVSIGIAVFPDHGTTAQQVLDAADDALYAAKAAGRDTYRVAGSTRSPSGHERKVEPEAGPVPGAAASVDDGATGAAAGVSGGAPGGPHPPRQSRGR